MSSHQHERAVSVAGARSRHVEPGPPRPRRAGWDPVLGALCWIGFGLLVGLALSECWP